MDRLDDIEALLAVAEEGNLTAATATCAAAFSRSLDR
jgi:hypothetical protein